MSFFRSLKSLFTPAPGLSPGEAAERIRRGEAVLVDVRTPGEWAGGVARSAVLLPLQDLTGPRAQWKPFLAGAAGKDLLLYCASGARSGVAARILAGEGFRAFNTGGLPGWVASGWPVVPPTSRHNPKPS